MPFVILVLGFLLIVVAYQGTHTRLYADLKQDLPGFFKWAAAISAIVALGYVPALQKPSRYLLGLVLLVIFIANYKAIINGFKALAGQGQSVTDAGSVPSTATNPTAAYSQSVAPTAAQAAGETQAIQAQTVATQNVISPVDPRFYLHMFTTPSSVGFGGHA